MTRMAFVATLFLAVFSWSFDPSSCLSAPSAGSPPQLQSRPARQSGAIFQVVTVVSDDLSENINETPGKSTVTCKDASGKPVSWWMIYKLPKIPGSQDKHLKEGSAHYFILPSLSWQRSSVAINDSRSIVGQTMVPLILPSDNNDEVARILYNDQPPDTDPTIKDGHTKGVVLANEGGGLWMLHSIPHFPNVTKSFSLDYPPGGLDNGQMLMCMSLSLPQLNEVVGGLFEYTKATFYNSSIPSSLQKQLNNLMDTVVGKKTVKSPPYFKQFNLQLEQLKVNVFAKGPKFHREIYADWIAEEFSDSLSVQSWQNGAHPFPSNCTTNSSNVLNILEKRMLGQNFSHTDDHSKWAVSNGIKSPKSSLVCIADLNRMKPQKSRGGVAICMEDEIIWKAFNSIVVETEPCKLPSNSFSSFNNSLLKTLRYSNRSKSGLYWRKHGYYNNSRKGKKPKL